ncbi:sorbose reductase [Malassezia yamatoensis]|uniref:Sorbose reductase n=1 Tax=Malassezia yamatoensis TaxID=253288 RepID=A0AAJ5YYJ4_9BASI|nr:sorbose reductase [Malassezia yamatoensis]
MAIEMKLEGTVVVSGGDRGIRDCAKAGANVAILYHSHPEAQQRAEEIAEEFGVKTKAYRCDVSDDNAVNQTITAAEKELGPITGLAANAGVSANKPAVELTTEDFQKVFGVNMLGVFNVAKTVAKRWIETGFKKGSIVVTSSMSAVIYNPVALNTPYPQLFYNASKGAASNMVKGLAAEWAQYGIRVNALEPGYCDTDMTKGSDPKVREYRENTVPLNRFSDVSEQSSSALFLLSDLSSYVTGTYIRPDGGCTLY